MQAWHRRQSHPTVESAPHLFQPGFSYRVWLTEAPDGTVSAYVQGIDEFYTELLFWNLMPFPVDIWLPVRGEFRKVGGLQPNEASDILQLPPTLLTIGLGLPASATPLVELAIAVFTGTFPLFLLPGWRPDRELTDREKLRNGVVEGTNLSTLPPMEGTAKYKVVNNLPGRTHAQFRIDGKVATEVNTGLPLVRTEGGSMFPDKRLPPGTSTLASESGIEDVPAGTHTVSVTDPLSGETIVETDVDFQSGGMYVIKVTREGRVRVQAIETSVMREMKQILVIA